MRPGLLPGLPPCRSSSENLAPPSLRHPGAGAARTQVGRRASANVPPPRPARCDRAAPASRLPRCRARWWTSATCSPHISSRTWSTRPRFATCSTLRPSAPRCAEPTAATTSHVLEKALELNAVGSAGTRSELEDRFLALTSDSGLPEPLVNSQVEDIEVDFHWPELNLVVEVDGPGHTRPRTQRQDHERDTRLRAAGQSVLRVADHEIYQRPGTVAARLLCATADVTTGRN